MRGNLGHFLVGAGGLALWVWISATHSGPPPGFFSITLLAALALGSRLLGFEVPPRITLSVVMPVQVAAVLVLGPWYAGWVSLLSFLVWFVLIIPARASRGVILSTFLFNAGMEGAMFGLTWSAVGYWSPDGSMDHIARALVACLVFKLVNESFMLVGHALRQESLRPYLSALRVTLPVELAMSPAAAILAAHFTDRPTVLTFSAALMITAYFAKKLADTSTGLDRANLALSRRVGDLDTLVTVGRAMQGPFDRARILDLIAPAAVAHSSGGNVCLVGGVHRADEEVRLLKAGQAADLPGWFPGPEHLVAAAGRAPAWDGMWNALGVPGDAWAYPLVHAQDLFGVLVAVSDPGEALPASSRRVLEGLALQAAANLRTMRIHEEELRRLVAEQENRELKALDRRKDEFVQTVAHQFQTPLTSIIGFGERLQGADAASAGIVVREGRRLSRMVEDLLQLSRIRSGQMELTRLPLDLGPLLGEIVEAIRPMADAASVTIVVEPGQGHPVFGDASRLRLVFDNLISNAIKYSDPGGTVSVSWEPGGGSHTRVRVQDSGIGIAEEDLPRVFDEFFRASSMEARSRKGTGLGLAIARSLVLLHEGTLSVSSGPGRGACFTVDLPVNPG